MAGRMARTCGAAGGLFTIPLVAACLAAAPDRLDDSFAADDSGRRPYVTGLVASSVSGPGDAVGIGGNALGGDGAFGVAAPQPAGDVRLELEARLPRDDGSWATTANVWRDVRIGDRLGVYAGGGLGMGSDAANEAGPAGATALAWQAGAGATYALTPRVTFDVGYRFHGLESGGRGAADAGEVVMAVRVFEPLRGWLR
jgi:opacity protein-like surface antigen